MKTTRQRLEPVEPFVFGCSTEIFPSEEIDALTVSGARLEALVAGVVAPVTAEDEHFLRVHAEEVQAINVLERAWVRLKGRRELEREEAAKIPEPPANPEDYGMVKWDHDRCWW